MCITCGCGGKEATIEDLDQTFTHKHKIPKRKLHEHKDLDKAESSKESKVGSEQDSKQ